MCFGFGEVFETNKKDGSSYTSLVSFRLTKADGKAVLLLWKVSPDNVHPCNVQGCVTVRLVEWSVCVSVVVVFLYSYSIIPVP